jgi:hypothetical protein
MRPQQAAAGRLRASSKMLASKQLEALGVTKESGLKP